MVPKDAQTEPKNQQIESQGATNYKKPAKLSSKGGKVEPQVLQERPKVAGMQEQHKKTPPNL